MPGREESAIIDKGLVPLRIVWGAMLFSLAIYVFLGVYLSGNLERGMVSESTFPIVRNVLYGVAIATLITTRLVRKKLLTAVGDRGTAEGQHPVMARYATAMIVSLALSESIGIYGLVLVLLGNNAGDLVLLNTMAAVAMVYYRPQKDEIVELIKTHRPDAYQ